MAVILYAVDRNGTFYVVQTYNDINIFFIFVLYPFADLVIYARSPRAAVPLLHPVSRRRPSITIRYNINLRWSRLNNNIIICRRTEPYKYITWASMFTTIFRAGTNNLKRFSILFSKTQIFEVCSEQPRFFR